MSEPLRPRRLIWSDDPVSRAEVIAAGAGYLRAEEVVALPTDTVYGLAALPASERAIGRLFQLKNRPREKAIALLVASVADIDRLAIEVPAAARTLAERFWPGGLTLVLRSAADPSTTVALRMPNHAAPLELIAGVGSPIATTSANRSSQPSPRTADEVLRQLPDGYPLLIDGGPCLGGVDSTVLDLTRTPPVILRPGAVTVEELEPVIGSLAS